MRRRPFPCREINCKKPAVIAAAHLATDIGAAVISMIIFAVHYRRMRRETV